MRTLTDLLLPGSCPCGDPAGPACRRCRAELLDGPARLVLPYPAPAGLPLCAAGAPYRGQVRRLVIAYKERGRRDLGRVLALALVQALVTLPAVRRALMASVTGRPAKPKPVSLLLVPVPVSRAAFRARGVDHVAALVGGALRPLRAVLSGSGMTVGTAPLLQVSGVVADQAGLTTADRAANVRGALSFRSPARSRRLPAVPGASPLVVVVDDVLTTGATIAEAARALASGGVRAHGAAVIATAVRHESAEGGNV